MNTSIQLQRSVHFKRFPPLPTIVFEVREVDTLAD